MVDDCDDLTESLEDTLETIEDRVVHGSVAGVVAALVGVRRDLVLIRRSLVPLSDLLRSMLSDAMRSVVSDSAAQFRDLIEHVTQSIARVDGIRGMEQGLVNLVISTQGDRLGETMKVLTVFSALFMPLSFVAGVYGMNFDRESPWNMPELGWRYGYLYAIGLMTLIGIGLVYFFWRRGWLNRAPIVRIELPADAARPPERTVKPP